MITAGIDVGSKAIKVVLIKDGEVLARGKRAAGLEQTESATQCLMAVAGDAGIDLSAIEQIVSTGAGRKAVTQAHSQITEVGADAIGAINVVP